MKMRDESVENEMLIWLEQDLFLIRFDEELEEEERMLEKEKGG